MKEKNIILLCAFRYALGRMTYVVSIVVDELIENWDNFVQGHKDIIVREIEEAISNSLAGMDIDIESWNRVLKHAKKR